jgi:hypothetical protein
VAWLAQAETVPPPDAAVRRHRELRELAEDTAAEGRRLWRQVDPGAILASWREVLGRLLVVLSGAQFAAAHDASGYVREALAEEGVDADPAGEVVTRRLAGIASDGRPLDTLLEQPARLAVVLRGSGRTMPRSLAVGQAHLDMIVRTQVADAGRVAEGVAIAATPRVGYVRMLVGAHSCSRCVVLAGRTYEWNAGFLRHPCCDCIHVPTSEAISGDLVTDPRAWFDGLSQAEQDRAFTAAGAQAIRDGADISQVVNARRGMRTATVFRREGVRITLEGTTRRGLAGQRLIAEGARLQGERAETVTRLSRTGEVERTVVRQRVQIPRLMPEQIYREASSREHAIRLLRRNGYIR